MRWIRILLALIAVAAIAGSVVVALTGSAGTDLGTLWHSGAPESLNLTQAITQRYLHPAVWTHVLLPVLLTPALVVFGVIAVAALLCWVLLMRRGAGPK